MTKPNLGKFSRGSEWRRWDLHVHTPESVLNNQFKGGWDKYVHKLYTEAIRNNIAAIGITDYFLIDGYKRLRDEYLAQPERLASVFAAELAHDPDYLDKIRSILVLPNIEFRLNKFVETKKKNSARLSMHVIFSDDVPIAQIESLFLAALKIDFRGLLHSPNEKRPLSRTSLEQLGECLRRDHDPFQDESNFFIGCMNASVDDDDIAQVLHSASTVFNNKYVLVLAEEYMGEIPWDGAGHQVRKILYQKCDAIFSANEKTINLLRSAEVAQKFGKAKPCLWGSDAHSLDTLFSSPGGKHCWIKADVTFAGLRQILNEPTTRCHVGDIPAEVQALRDQRKTYIKSVHLSKRPNSTLPEKWFDGCSLEFNSAMVAIIGNKGAGKSALADTLAVLGATRVEAQHFSFLRPERFKKRESGSRSDRAQEFQAVSLWSNGEEITRPLSHVVAPDEMERVRYLPQGYLEKICNERDEQAQNAFRAELDRVIFSHVRASDRLGKTSLAELIDLRTDEIIRSASNLKRHVRDLNHKITVLEQKLSTAAITALDEKISSKERELRQVDESRPPEVPNPADTAASQFACAADDLKKLEAQKQQRAQIISQIAYSTQQLGELRIALQSATKVSERLKKFKAYYDSVLHDVERDLRTLGINSHGVLTAHVDAFPIDQFVNRTSDEIGELERLLEPDDAKSLHAAQAQLESR